VGLGNQSKSPWQEGQLSDQLGARVLRDKLNAFLWLDRPHVAVRELVDWCRKYLYLPRIASDQVILDALVNPSSALTGESTFYFADSWDGSKGRYQGGSEFTFSGGPT
jgi:hypothetical protein